MKLSKFFPRRNSHNTPVQQQNVNEPPPLPSLDISFELTRGRILAQFQEVDGLDVKANFIKGAATGLVGTALVLQAALLTNRTHSYSNCSAIIPIFIHAFIHALPPLIKQALPLVPLLVSYVIVIITSHNAYNIDDYELVPNPRELLENYLEAPEIITKVDLFKEMVYDYEENESKINRKARWVRYALFWLDIEGLALVILLVIQAIC